MNGVSSTYFSKKYNIPKGIIKTWSMKIYHPEKYFGKGQKRGRSKEKNLTKEDWKEKYKILKKTGISQGKLIEIVTFINLYRNNYKLTSMCGVLNISPKIYYKYRNKEVSDYYDYLIIKEIFDEFKGTYG